MVSYMEKGQAQGKGFRVSKIHCTLWQQTRSYGEHECFLIFCRSKVSYSFGLGLGLFVCLSVCFFFLLLLFPPPSYLRVNHLTIMKVWFSWRRKVPVKKSVIVFCMYQLFLVWLHLPPVAIVHMKGIFLYIGSEHYSTLIFSFLTRYPIGPSCR